MALLCLLRQVAPAQVVSEYTPPYENFSANVIGFVLITIPSGYSLVSASLIRAAGPSDPFPTATVNAIPNLFVAAGTNYHHLGVTKIRSDGRFGTAYYTPNIGWTESDMSLLPGEGAVLWNPGTTFTNITFGGVLQGSLTNVLAAGLTLCSSIVPQSGLLTKEIRTYLDHARGNLVDQAGAGAAKRAA